jgi:hypothetical protein
MAVWQFAFSLVPTSAVKDVLSLAQYQKSPDGPKVLEESEIETLWNDSGQLRDIAEAASCILPEVKHWSAQARMFGDEESNRIEVWNDDIYCRADLRTDPTVFLHAVLDLSVRFKCKIVIDGPGIVIEPSIAAMKSQMQKSIAYKFCENPREFLRNL